jgi:ribosomal protein L22
MLKIFQNKIKKMLKDAESNAEILKKDKLLVL